VQVKKSLADMINELAAKACEYAGSLANGDEGRIDPCATDEEELPEPLVTIRVPAGATDVSYDAMNRRFVVSFASASDETIGATVAAGMSPEDRVMLVDVPIFLDVFPAVTANIASISLFGVDIIAVCMLPLDLNKKGKDKDGGKDDGKDGDGGGFGETATDSECPEIELPEGAEMIAGLADKPANAPSKLAAYYFTGVWVWWGCRARRCGSLGVRGVCADLGKSRARALPLLAGPPPPRAAWTLP
jgi:hypothetical protein